MPPAQKFKPSRISIRLKPEIKQRIKKAAALQETSITSFVIDSLTASANKILKGRTPVKSGIYAAGMYRKMFSSLQKPQNNKS